ncbi:MAG: hypothetical protein H8E68_00190 [Kiritimatiellaeota bacterium]|nr:hypothetical protein [Kiritimatiellota bacterium]
MNRQIIEPHAFAGLARVQYQEEEFDPGQYLAETYGSAANVLDTVIHGCEGGAKEHMARLQAFVAITEGGSAAQFVLSAVELQSLCQKQLEQVESRHTSNPDVAIPDCDDVAGTRFLFRLDGEKWKVIFDDSAPFFLADLLGARYIDYLLHHPGEVITALELEQRINPAKAEVRTAQTITKKHTPEALAKIARECKKLRAERDSFIEEGRTVEASQMADDVAELERILKNEARTVLGDSGENARGNVSKAIRTVEGRLKKMETPAARAFARRLAESLHKGFKLSYTPPEKIIWL